ncbi:M20/M25/M40 family metallo-hydrolase [Marispirochaeta aestuarii]|uniref:M20/M25/M40 family metallo-hydrolase n=1 Tax=Marispirochaeta aestuarii TaxID=1963862 RepID=UPI0029C86E07|nr:M20/M25/M40 family metallo-hydrolase [Marispirochaeta aestuarii]
MVPTRNPREVLVRLLQELIRNSCVNNGNGGNESRSAESLRRFFQGYGLKADIFEKVPGRGNLVLRVPGTDPAAPALAFMGHTDVVPAEAADWKRDPFGGELLDGEVWGRGTVDMLNMTAAQAVGFAEAITRNGPFPGDLLYLALADEEASGTYGARWLTDEHWDAVACDYMVSEIGGFFISGRRGESAALGIGEKGVAWIRLTARGVPGHGSIPFGSSNAIDTLMQAGERLGHLHFPHRPGHLFRSMARGASASLWEELFLRMAPLRGLGLKRIYRRSPGAARWLHAASSTTSSIGIIGGGSKINVIPGEAHLDLDIRIIPGEDLDTVLKRLKSRLWGLKKRIEIEVLEYFPPTISPASGPLVEASSLLLKDLRSDADILPILISGATDGRFWRRRGTRVYGFSLFGDEMTLDRFSGMLHGVDERISLSSLYRSLEYYTRLPGVFFSGSKGGR